MQKKQSVVWAGITIAVIFVLGNIYLSQFVSPLFSGITYANDKQATVQFLQKIATHSDFTEQYASAIETFGPELKGDVFAEKDMREKEIAYYLDILKKNQNARDVLIKLATLYKVQGDNVRSIDYLKKARAVDPESPPLSF